MFIGADGLDFEGREVRYHIGFDKPHELKWEHCIELEVDLQGTYVIEYDDFDEKMTCHIVKKCTNPWILKSFPNPPECIALKSLGVGWMKSFGSM